MAQVRSRLQLNQISNMICDVKNLILATTQALLNPSLTVPFFWGPIYRHIPHLRSLNPFGQLSFTGEKTDEFTTAALTTSNGIATYWAGPFPVLYVVSHDARRALVRESHVGVIDKPSAKYLKWLSGGNNVMGTFPDFQPINSETYKIQREFLLKRFHGGAKQRLSEIEKTTTTFLDHYYKENQNPRPLRELIAALVLRTSSHLLGLTQTPLDSLYFEKPEFRNAIDRVAKYGISERTDLDLEETLYQFFLRTFQGNFDQIRDETSETNYIRNIFASMDIEFPLELDDFYQLSKSMQHDIAMNFAATGLGAMVHSTVNTLDWAIARLLNDHDKLDELVQLMKKHKDLDLTQEDIFDKTGPLFPVCKWVLHNVFLYPPFSHEFFLNSKLFVATLSDGSTITVPSMSFVIVNYLQCNRSDEKMTSAMTFAECLDEKSTTGRFIMNERVASFGGSKTSRENHHTRICPGAKTSLYEQMIIIAILLRDYSLQPTEAKEIFCDIDRSKHPLCVRVNQGDVVLRKSNQSVDDIKKSISHVESRASIEIESTSKEPECTKERYLFTASVFGFFNRATTLVPSCDAKTAAGLIRTGLTMGAALALHNLTS